MPHDRYLSSQHSFLLSHFVAKLSCAPRCTLACFYIPEQRLQVSRQDRGHLWMYHALSLCSTLWSMMFGSRNRGWSNGVRRFARALIVLLLAMHQRWQDYGRKLFKLDVIGLDDRVLGCFCSVYFLISECISVCTYMFLSACMCLYCEPPSSDSDRLVVTMLCLLLHSTQFQAS